MDRYKKPLLAMAAISAVILASVLALRLPQSFVDEYTTEDGLIETVGAVCLLVGSVLLLLVYRNTRRTPPQERPGRIKQLSYLALALLFFVAAGEEISWGQRILGIETPEAIREVNSQNEINLHNLYGDESGQNLSSRVFQLFWLGWGIAVPVLAVVWGRFRHTLGRFIPILPLWLALLFAGQQLLWKPVEANWRSDPSAWNGTYRPDIGDPNRFSVETLADARERGVNSPAGLDEVMEANVQLLLLVAAVVLFLRSRQLRRDTPGRGAAAVPVEPDEERSAPAAAV